MTVLDKTFSALADPTRRDILSRLVVSDLTITELAKPYRMSLPAVSKHLKLLEEAGLITREKEGRVRHCHLLADPLKEVSDWMDKYKVFWTNQLDALDAFLSKDKSNDKNKEKEND